MTVTKSLTSIPACLLFLYAILLGSIFSGCIEPNTEDLWSITTEGVLQTEGFARDIAIEGNTGYVAAGQAGVQVWNLSDQTQSGYFAGYVEGGAFLEFEDVSIIGRNPLNNLIFASESNEDVKIFHYATGDSDITYRNTIMSARTKGFVSFPLADDQFIMYAADNDDGMKWHTYDLDTTIIFNIEFIVWTPNGGDEIYTPGKPQGIDSDGETYIAMAVDQLGVELYSIDSLGTDPVLIGRVDTEGNAEQVTLSQMGVFAACDDAGATFIPWQDFTDSGGRTQPLPTGMIQSRFAEDLTVDHIAIYGVVAALSLGAKGIALYDVTDPSAPEEKGIFPIGYSYRSQFWGEKLVVCTREGLQIITIEQ